MDFKEVMEVFKKELIEYSVPDYYVEMEIPWKVEMFWELLEEYIRCRIEWGRPLRETAVRLIADKLNRYSPEACIEALKEAIIQGHTSLNLDFYESKKFDEEDIRKSVDPNTRDISDYFR